MLSIVHLLLLFFSGSGYLISGAFPVRYGGGTKEFSFQTPYCPYMSSANSYSQLPNCCTARQLRVCFFLNDLCSLVHVQ